MNEPTPKADVAIIGAGPIGLELAVALKQAAVPYLQFDAGQVGHTISWFPPQTRFFSSPERIAIAGVPLQTTDQSKATREEYLAYLRAVVQQFELAVRTFERVTSIRREGDAFLLKTRHGGRDLEYRARNVVAAIGDMHAPRLLGVPGEDLPHVSHYFNEPHRYFRQRLLIVGGKNSAVEAAVRCYRLGARITLSYRGERFDEKAVKYWLLPEIQGLIRAGQIEFLPRTRVTRIEPDVVTLQSVDDGASRPVPADFVLLMTGYVMDTTLLAEAGVRLEGASGAPAHDPETMQTNVPGLYVAGTASAGTQDRFRVFIENGHEHVAKIVRALTGCEFRRFCGDMPPQHPPES